jgi:Rod binding domain-containing protein
MSPVDAQFSASLALAKPLGAPPKPSNAAQVDKVAKDFESIFINEMLGSMFQGIATDGEFGGGPGEAIFRSMMIEHYSKTITAQGGFGLADAVKHELLKTQEKMP